MRSDLRENLQIGIRILVEKVFSSLLSDERAASRLIGFYGFTKMHH